MDVFQMQENGPQEKEIEPQSSGPFKFTQLNTPPVETMPFHFNNERRKSSGSFNRERRASGEQIRELMENSVADMEKRG